VNPTFPDSLRAHGIDNPIEAREFEAAMNQVPNDLRNVLRQMQEPAKRQPDIPVPDHAERLAAHEARIHSHPCPCGSSRTYGECCLTRPNQEHLELKRRRELARLRAGDEDL